MPPLRKNTAEATATRDGWISVAAAARSLGVAYTTVVALALKGELTTQVVADRIFVCSSSVERFRAKA